MDDLRSWNEGALALLIDRYTPQMRRVAQGIVSNWAVAEEVVQETWLAVLTGIDRFEERSSLRTWVFRILTHLAYEHARRENRHVSLEVRHGPAAEIGTPRRSRGGRASSSSARHHQSPEERLLAAEVRALVLREVERLSPARRAVITLRDLEGLTPAAVCATLGISEVHQRVLLHRARRAIRPAIRAYVESAE